MSVDELDELRRRLSQRDEVVDQLRTVFEARIVVEQAKGVLAERFRLDVDDAFELLRYAARVSRTDIHRLSQRVVSEPATPNPIIVALARQARWRAAAMRERNEAIDERLRRLVAAFEAQVERIAASGRPARGQHARLARGLFLDPIRHRAEVDDRIVPLTPTEFRLLALLASEPERPFSRDEILRHLWESAFVGDRHNVDVHVRNLRQKIERDPARPERIMTVRGVGYRLYAGEWT